MRKESEVGTVREGNFIRIYFPNHRCKRKFFVGWVGEEGEFGKEKRTRNGGGGRGGSGRRK